ncbi:hypothetical protein BJV74DRAFT_798374 [Russula compacta]|nr:hypothetical protein BJV74DRAFT_798374 [Russula compacta]
MDVHIHILVGVWAGVGIPIAVLGKRKGDDFHYYEDTKTRKLAKLAPSGLNSTSTYISLQSDEEGKKRDASQRHLLKLLFTELEVFDFDIDDTETTSNGYLLGPHNGPLVAVKWELMLGGAAAQLGADVARPCVSVAKDIYLGWLIPALGIIIRGSYIFFHSFVMVDKQIRSLPLSSPFECSPLDRPLQTLYAPFDAARTLLSERQFLLLADVLQTSRAYESQAVSSGSSSELVEFLGGDVVDRFVYTAKTSGPEPETIFVKFSQQYSEDLHNLCTDKGLAPKLLAFEELPGGWIVMVQTMHDDGYAHGDLRHPCFLVQGEKPLLIDFDYGGKEGEAIYPDKPLLPILRKEDEGNTITKQRDVCVMQETINLIRDEMRSR